MKRKLKSVLIIGLMAVLGAVIIAGCGNGGGSSTPPPSAPKSGDLVWTLGFNPSVGAGSDVICSMVKDSAALYVVGYDEVSGYQRSRIEKRSLANGGRIIAFGTGGYVSAATSTSSAFFGVATDSSALYAVGYQKIAGYNNWRIEKRDLVTGASVTAFGNNGVVTSGTATGHSSAYAIAVDSQYMYVVGYDASPSGDNEWRIEKRSLSTGQTVTTFGNGDGVITSHPGLGNEKAQGIALYNGYLYIVGYDTVAGSASPGWRIEKRDANTGILINTFGIGGVISESTSTMPVDDVALAIAVDPAQSVMYVVGYDEQTGRANDSQWRIEKRWLSNGLLDTSFGTGGVLQINPSDSVDDAQTIAIDADHLYVGGYDSNTVTGDEQWRIEKRSLLNGALDTTFGSGGVVVSNANYLAADPNFAQNAVNAIVVDNTNIYAGGFDYAGINDDEWRLEKRLK